MIWTKGRMPWGSFLNSQSGQRRMSTNKGCALGKSSLIGLGSVIVLDVRSYNWQTENSKQTSLSHFVLGITGQLVPSYKLILQTVLADGIAHWIVIGGRPISIVNDYVLQLVICVAFQNDEYKLSTSCLQVVYQTDSIIHRMFQETSQTENECQQSQCNCNYEWLLNKESREDMWKFIRCAVEQNCSKQTDEQNGKDNSQSAEAEPPEKKKHG